MGLEALEVDYNWIRIIGSRLKVDETYWNWTRIGLDVV